MTAPEEWRPVPGFPGYEVSSLARVVSHKGRSPRLLTATRTSQGYLKVGLSGPNGPASVRLHRVVAAAFIGPCPDGLQVRHLDGDPGNNLPANLRYGSQSENNRDQVLHGTHRMARRTECGEGHPLDEANTHIGDGYRRCRTCLLETWRRKNAKRRQRAAA